jgi:(1->4)-alpha-D-glucan 1-alpha-D-glucosylmutase
MILGPRLEELEQLLGPEAPAFLEYQSIRTAVKNLPARSETDPARRAERQREKEVIKRRLAALTDEHPAVRQFLEQTLAQFNGSPGDPHSVDLLDGLLNEQAFRVSFWRVASDEINYRRFFDVNELAALSMEREEVFLAAHELIVRLLGEGNLDGLRVDHPDGLFDPREYLQRLQQYYLVAVARHVFDTDPDYRGLEWNDLTKPLLEEIARPHAAGHDDLFWRPLYVVVEKILGSGESLPDDWPVYGTSGYEFLNALNGLFVDGAHAEAFRRLYREWIHDDMPFAEVVYQKKFLILQVALSSELHMLAHQLDRLAQKNRLSRDFTLTTLRHALREVIACFPVYRSYLGTGESHDADRKYVQLAVRRAQVKNPAISASVFNFVRDVLLGRWFEPAAEEELAEERRFAGKFEQVTAPVMAKGLEDTAFYVYNRLLSLNEVGGNPGRFGVTPEALHQFNRERQAKWPWSLSATSTHDTKRSEDVRARLNVLSEMPAQWQEALTRWHRLNEPHRLEVDEETVPDLNEEYFLYQTLLGAWPLEPYGAEECATFVERIQAYTAKAMHEAKVHTSWINPNVAFDEAMHQFVARVLDEEANRPFLEDFRAFQRRLSHYGLLNSLGQTLLKITSPGVPDFYQGTEVWDFSLVDPDNRRPVDYPWRRRLLDELRAGAGPAGSDRRELARQLLRAKEDGRVKLYLTAEALRCRREHPGLFATGEYLPLEVAGARREHVFAFARRRGKDWAVVVVPRLLTHLVPQPDGLPLGPEVWQDTYLLLPELAGAPGFANVFTGEELRLDQPEGRPLLFLANALAHFPVALFVGRAGADG